MPDQTALTTPYLFEATAAPHSAGYLTDQILAVCRELGGRKILDLGCGKGALCQSLSAAGFDVVGCDPSDIGIASARSAFPHIPFHTLGVYDDPAPLGGQEFDIVVSTEVIEHLYLPGALPEFAAKVLRPGGSLIVSTPYHGYLKNVLVAVCDQFDAHMTSLWNGGHIKFWSRATLTRLLTEHGFTVRRFIGAGRLPFLWKSMILVAEKTPS